MSKNIIKYYVKAVYVDFVNDDKTIIHTYLGQNCDLFLRSCAPFNKLHDGVSISCIFRKHLKASGIIHKPGDGKTMSGLRRMLATEMIAEGTPISTASQVLKVDYLTEKITLEWCIQRDTEQSSGYRRRALALREFTKYLFAISKSSYILPSDYTARAKRYTPYIFSDSELIALFQASDHIKINSQSPNRELIIPVMLKLIYFCGLRPNEGRKILK